MNQDSNGVFVIQLDESTGFNVDSKEDVKINKGFAGKLKAKKTVFAFNNKLILIGSYISSIDQQHATETTLFQSALTAKHSLLQTSLGNCTNFPYQADFNTDKQKNRKTLGLSTLMATATRRCYCQFFQNDSWLVESRLTPVPTNPIGFFQPIGFASFAGQTKSGQA